MNRIFVTGDIHGDVDIPKLKPWKKALGDLDETDILMVCGDMGFFWDDGGNYDRYIKRFWEQQPYTVLWIDGNHENFNTLSAVPVTEKWGGKVQQCARNVYHLCRGETFKIYGKEFFVFGGASSHDKWCRKENYTWWSQELPTEEEMENGRRKLDEIGYSVDFILTHCADDYVQTMIDPSYERDVLTNYLREVSITTSWKKWFIGHYHLDRPMPDNTRLIYKDIIQIV